MAWTVVFVLRGAPAPRPCDYGVPRANQRRGKAIDVAWVSVERRASKPNDPVYLVAPEICVEVESPANSEEELMERKRLFFDQGAQEFWVCDLFGKMAFYGASGGIPQSALCPDFQKAITLD